MVEDLGYFTTLVESRRDMLAKYVFRIIEDYK